MEFIAILRKHASDRQWETIGTLLGVEGADPTHPQLLHPL
jgi:hypothetical protein